MGTPCLEIERGERAETTSGASPLDIVVSAMPHLGFSERRTLWSKRNTLWIKLVHPERLEFPTNWFDASNSILPSRKMHYHKLIKSQTLMS